MEHLNGNVPIEDCGIEGSFKEEIIQQFSELILSGAIESDDGTAERALNQLIDRQNLKMDTERERTTETSKEE